MSLFLVLNACFFWVLCAPKINSNHKRATSLPSKSPALSKTKQFEKRSNSFLYVLVLFEWSYHHLVWEKQFRNVQKFCPYNQNKIWVNEKPMKSSLAIVNVVLQDRIRTKREKGKGKRKRQRFDSPTCLLFINLIYLKSSRSCVFVSRRCFLVT